MLLERAEILIKEGLEDGFSTAMTDTGLPMLSSVAGVISAKIGRGVENPGKFMFLVEWESMDAHAAFNKAPICAQFRALIGRFSKGGSMEHFRFNNDL